MVRSSVALSLILLVACDVAVTNPYLPEEGVTQFDPPAIYRQWWAELTEHAAIPAPFPSVEWYTVAGDGWQDSDGNCQRGLWFPHGQIYIAETLKLRELAIKHEMLHELLGGDPEHTHPLFRFYGVGLPGMMSSRSRGGCELETAGLPPGATCGEATFLEDGVPYAGDLRASECRIEEAPFRPNDGRSFHGPEPGGTHFYHLYLVDVEDGQLVRVEAWRGSLDDSIVLLVHDAGGEPVADASGGLAVYNQTGGAHRYQVVVSTLNEGKTGTYGIEATFVE